MKLSLLILLVLSAALPIPCFSQWYLNKFRDQVKKAVEAANNVLETTRNPKLFLDEENHTWDDKFLLVEYITNNAILVVKHLLEHILSVDDLKTTLLLDATTNSKRIRFQALRTCVFLQEKEHSIVTSEIEEEVTEFNEAQGKDSSKNTQKKVYTTVKEYHWRVSSTYKFLACPNGNCVDNPIELLSRNGSMVLITRTKDIPITDNRAVTSDINLTWLLGMLKDDEDVGAMMTTTNFKINRTVDTCRTPRRNNEMTETLDFFNDLVTWAGEVGYYFNNDLRNAMYEHNPVDSVKHPSIPSLTTTGMSTLSFLPITPMFVEPNGTLPDTDFVRVLFHEFIKSIEDDLNQAKKEYPVVNNHTADDQGLITFEDVRLNSLLHALAIVKQNFATANLAIEENLKVLMKQALGKEIRPSDFDEFMGFYKNKFLGGNYTCAPFSHAIRRPEHYPDGILSIEAGSSIGGGSSSSEPLETLVRYIPGGDVNAAPISIPLNAATSVEITGDRYLHGLLLHHFTYSSPSATLAARARQFSSFILVIGNMAGPNQFKPKHAIIVKNKDELLIPLLMEVLPSAKEFKEAISSLSPEQQAFAKEFRGMQLESSVFAVSIIQIKPQMEKLLGLTEGALLKEIQLSEQLMSLFIEYQIPSDLLSFDGQDSAGPKERLEAVKGHVKAVLDVIDGMKKEELREEQQRTDMRVEMAYATSARPRSVPESVARSSAARSMPQAAAGVQMSLDEASVAGQPKRGSKARRLSDEASSEPAGEGRASFSETNILKTSSIDFTLIPKLLDEQLEKYDKDGALRTTIIKSSQFGWSRKRQQNLLSPSVEMLFRETDIENENQKAMDLLDALSRSGTLAIAASELHVIIGVTHWFENTIIGTLVEDNINPIEKVERSLLILGSAIYGEPPANLIANDEIRERLTKSFPALLELK